MNLPLVTVICLSYNHERFVKDAILSVINQTYSNIQLIVVDDFSDDNTVAIIKSIAHKHPSIQTLFLAYNHGNCKAFNLALQLAKGKYIIDFATDDLMLPQRIEEQVAFFEMQDEKVGVIFSNAEFIDESGNVLGVHADPNTYVPQGDVFREVLRHYFICPPTIMVKKQVFDALSGYDEALAYEDFDFWVRASRRFHFWYQHDVLTKRRIVKKSLANSFAWSAKMTNSTLMVCEKAFLLCKTKTELEALQIRVNYELCYAFRNKHWNVVSSYLPLLVELEMLSFKNRLFVFLAKCFLKFNWFKN